MRFEGTLESMCCVREILRKATLKPLSLPSMKNTILASAFITREISALKGKPSLLRQ